MSGNGDKKEILDSAVKKVPVVRYAIGIAGIGSVIASILSWGLNPLIIIIGVPIMIFLMIALSLFEHLSEQIKDYARLPIRVLVWAVILYVTAMPILCIAIVFTQKPIHLYKILIPDETNPSANVSTNQYALPTVAPIEPKPLVLEKQSVNIVVPWNGSSKTGNISIPVDSKYEYVSHMIIENSKNGNASYIDKGLINSKVVVEYSVSSQGSLFDQKRSWLNLELQVTLRPKS